ncbi:UNVERIFIED_CONTAM: Na+-transporting NADH:ubiquinone oxidoreductase subunit D [Clostridioides difficile]|uniref:RnfABCDGE type electron transport complex subunit D n=1 Tax=Clostridioides difficile TaxID=1496 RepID=UPI00038C8384|nr:RnfABCDGE type electron transport complex subunit D [Clostridioides difficile]EQE87460.1 electron transport complex, RnfABCDGE type, D subunit [Clostridioides difficile CD69]MBY1131458.1 RnfABCDGE type electron transport complex subunit D [Clostridioides difficile]MBY1882383.1 RnfABCDGE type electron transport complex subunit D [Clostridioides difficile]MBZ0779150.1 RnfABCDGE type electron transport complex subunit D [Clostridioides difficile]MBZ0853336.1 RnfABCDGE type electron transport c
MENKLIVSSSPHVRSNEDTSYIMKQVIIALLPAAVAGVYFFRLNALSAMFFCILGTVGTEFLYQKFTKQKSTIGDFSAVVTGLLLAFNVPASLPWWMCLVGGIFAILVVKMVFGGIGCNFVNPALAARAFLLASFPVAMTTWTQPGVNWIGKNLDAVTTATPLSFLKNGAAGLADLSSNGISLADMMIGNIGGCIGETSAILLLLGGVYLMYKGIINYVIPVFYIATVFILTFLLGGFNITFAIYQLFAGGLMLGGFFMLTDYTTSPMTKKGQIIYAVLAGLITTVIRMYGGYPEGVSYSILLVNCLAPLIDKFVRNRVFGEVAK